MDRLEQENIRDFYIPKGKMFSGMWLIYWRQKRNLTQKELAELINVQYQVLQRYEKGITESPSANRLMQIAEALNIDINELFDH